MKNTSQTDKTTAKVVRKVQLRRVLSTFNITAVPKLPKGAANDNF